MIVNANLAQEGAKVVKVISPDAGFFNAGLSKDFISFTSKIGV